ncbi:GNAT family N-acetyltransferase [Kitasatospora sp. NPDC092948]|uniref:GNAT family N-acetyltransferase n=1 Tax=Kitasatospora sp. NPDC092948 TaxID=3364088 RepID=UPI0037FA990B
MTSTTPTVRPLAATDEARWRELFRQYREFYRLEESEEVVSRVWAWLTDPGHECDAFVAEADGAVVGFAHHRPVPSSYTGTTGIFLDDLFTDPAVRGRGVGRALVERLRELAAAEGRSFVQWVTAEDNRQAQALYDTLAERTTWVTYESEVRPGA